MERLIAEYDTCIFLGFSNWTQLLIYTIQGSKIAIVRSYLRVPQAAGQVKILIFLVKIKIFPMYANIFCDAGQVPILRYFEACHRFCVSACGKPRRQVLNEAKRPFIAFYHRVTRFMSFLGQNFFIS